MFLNVCVCIELIFGPQRQVFKRSFGWEVIQQCWRGRGGECSADRMRQEGRCGFSSQVCHLRFWNEMIVSAWELRFSTSPFPLSSGRLDILIYMSCSDSKVYIEDV